jgi:hypothetical protein
VISLKLSTILSLASIYRKVYVPFSNCVSSITIELSSVTTPIFSVGVSGFSGFSGEGTYVPFNILIISSSVAKVQDSKTLTRSSIA